MNLLSNYTVREKHMCRNVYRTRHIHLKRRIDMATSFPFDYVACMWIHLIIVIN